MWSKIYIIFALLRGTLQEDITAKHPFGMIRSLTDGVKSAGYHVIYGDEDLMLLNDVNYEIEKENVLKKDPSLDEALPPLPPEDVKCLMSVDRYCSKDMLESKAVIIKAIRDDCKQCTNVEKEKAGKIIASMMAHDHMAWKLFLTRLSLVPKSKKARKEEIINTKTVGLPEEIPRSKESFVFPGFKIRVKRYAAIKL